MARRIVTACIIALACLFCAEAFAGYGTDLSRATKNHRIFDFVSWDARLIMHATFFSDSFRQSYEQRFAERNHFDALEEARFVEEQDRRQANGWEFFVTFYTKKEYKKFSIEPDSFWKMRMTTASGEVVKPIEIEQLPVTPYEQVMFKHLNRWSKAYRVTFPKVSLGDKFDLTIQSVVGESTMKWKLKDEKKE